MHTKETIAKYLEGLTKLITYGERQRVEELYDEYTSYLEVHEGVAILWAEGNDELLDKHVAVSDYIQE